MRRLAAVTDTWVERFNNWLGSRAGFLQALTVSLVWNVAVILGLDRHGFLYLYLATELGIITQFNLAIIGRRSSRKVDEALAALLALARNDEADGDALIAQGEAIKDALDALQQHLAADTRGGA